MPRRAGKRRTAKRALIARIKEAKAKDEETRRAAPRIIEEQILLDLPPLLRVKPSEGKGEKRKEEEEGKEQDSLHLFPEELDRDLDWSPDEFEREYFRLWEEETNERWERKRKKRARRMEELFGEDSDMEKEREEIEKDRRTRMERERKAEEIRLFGEISDSEQEEERMEMEGQRMDWEEEGRERNEKEMDWEEARMEDDDVIIVEEESTVEKLEKSIDREIGRRNARQRGGRTAASRAIVPEKVQGHWLKARSRLDLSLPLSLKRRN